MRRLDKLDRALLKGAEENAHIPPTEFFDQMVDAIANMRSKNYGEYGYPTLMADLFGCIVSPGFRRVWAGGRPE